jgi:hypothetical protein
MINIPINLKEKENKSKNKHNNEVFTRQKVEIKKSKIDSEMAKTFNENNIRKNERQMKYETLQDNEEKLNEKYEISDGLSFLRRK